MKWTGRASPNIALIKYMGKVDSTINAPINPSLSYTLADLWTEVRVDYLPEKNVDSWQAHEEDQFVALNAAEQGRFLTHVSRVRQSLGFTTGGFIISSRNNFPRSCGIASSASSFAALTDVVSQAICEIQGRPPLAMKDKIRLSREGSGSSARSFFKPWALWKGLEVQPIELPYKNLKHLVAIVSGETKAVTSTEAHRRVTSSLLFNGRKERAETRLSELLTALETKNWRQAFEVCWAECFDMHALFLTAQPGFSFIHPNSIKVAEMVRKHWDAYGDGPIFTMDAGPNVHLLFRQNQETQLADLANKLGDRFNILRGST